MCKIYISGSTHSSCHESTISVASEEDSKSWFPLVSSLLNGLLVLIVRDIKRNSIIHSLDERTLTININTK